MRAALAGFGITDAIISYQPSFSSCVYLIHSGGRSYHGKILPLSEEPRVRHGIAVSEVLTAGGIHTCHYNTHITGERYVKRDNNLFTVTDTISGVPLRELVYQVDPGGIARFLATVHELLNDPLNRLTPPESVMWNDGNISGRLLSAQKKLELLEENSERSVMLKAIQRLQSCPTALLSLTAIDSNAGLIHGDFWPGNLIVTDQDSEVFALIDLESCAYAPFLTDVVQFIDLAYSDRSDGKKTLQLNPALEFAKEYVTARGLSIAALRTIPDLTLAARACSILWIVETHLERGPGAMDCLVANDLEAIEHVAEWRDAWLQSVGGS